jgi:hypothetical protein
MLASDRDTAGARWAYHRDFGRTRLLVVGSRQSRVLHPDGHTQMVDDAEWRWIWDHAHGDFDHLIIASTLPVFLSHGIHNIEAWNEAVCAGAWGSLASRAGEKLRRALDLEHWAAFGDSFHDMLDLLHDVGTDASGDPPAKIMLLGGDVHHAYVADVTLRSIERVRSRIYQVVCSPFRNPLTPHPLQRVFTVANTPPARWATRALARAAGVTRPRASWRLNSGPTFMNSIGTLETEGRAARVTIWCSQPNDETGTPLEPLFSKVLAAG